MGAGACWKALLHLRWGLDLVELLELCQGLIFLFRDLGCWDTSLVVSSVCLTLGMDPGLGWDLPHPVHPPLKPIINLLLEVQEGAGSDLPVGEGRGALHESPGSKFSWIRLSRALDLCWMSFGCPWLTLDAALRGKQSL